MRLLIPLILAVLLMPLGLAHDSAERTMIPTVSVESIEGDSYTFHCTAPESYGQQRFWAFRLDSGQILDSEHNDEEFWTATLDEPVVYHVNCGMWEQDGETQVYHEGDFHIDLREPGYTADIMIDVQHTQGTWIEATCNPTKATNYNLYWYFNNQESSNQQHDFTNTQTIATEVPYPGPWDVTCGIWDIERNEWSQSGVTIEFFAEGPAYVPNPTGCMPWECGVNETGTNETEQNDTVTNQTACYSSLADMPATCTGGEISSDVMGGCREVTCGSLTVMACEKPGSYQPEFFELYKLAEGSGEEICIAGTCLSSSGFAKSDSYPVCSGEQTPEPEPEPDPEPEPGNETNSTQEVTVSVAPWFPQGLNAVLVCDAPFLADWYDWEFGDGSKQLYMLADDVWHTFPSTGTYEVSCTAYKDEVPSTGTASITI